VTARGKGRVRLHRMPICAVLWRSAVMGGDEAMKMGIHSTAAAMICLACAVCAGGCDNAGAQIMPSVEESHIGGNVPVAETFDVVLARDLGAYFASRGLTDPQITYELLRRGPTQSGVAYPKFYLWVSAASGQGDVMAGAVRVAAIDRVRFEITDFVARADIVKNPDGLASIFPAALLPAIRAKAAGP
jgi:hypothetical protein